MKSRVCFTPLSVSFQPERRTYVISSAVNRLDGARARRQRRLLLGVSILLILSWTIGAIWLIGVRRGERSTAEVVAQQGTIAALYAGERERSRQADTGKISLFLVKAE